MTKQTITKYGEQIKDKIYKVLTHPSQPNVSNQPVNTYRLGRISTALVKEGQKVTVSSNSMNQYLTLAQFPSI